MSRATFIVRDRKDRERVAHHTQRVPVGTRISFKTPVRRTTAQNDRMWAMLTDIARQVEWHGRRLRPDDWKLIFLDALKRELRIVPNIDGDGFVNLGRSSSDLTREEMSDLIELMFAFGANPDHPVTFKDDDSFEEPTVGNEVV